MYSYLYLQITEFLDHMQLAQTISPQNTLIKVFAQLVTMASSPQVCVTLYMYHNYNNYYNIPVACLTCMHRTPEHSQYQTSVL